MNRSRVINPLKYFVFFVLSTLAVLSADANTYQWTNTLGGDWSALANWSPNGFPGANDAALITTPGTYTITSTNTTAFAALTLGASSGAQTLFLNLNSANVLSNRCTINANGVLVVTNVGLQGSVTIAAGGQLQISGAVPKNFYGLALVNQGTVTLSGGGLNFGITAITNSGLWQITGDTTINYGGGTTPVWINSGTLRKSGGTGTTTLSGLNFVNSPGGVVDVLLGTLQFAGAGTNVISGTFSATAPGGINFLGICTDGGGGTVGTGVSQFTSGTLLLQTNVVPGLKLVGGDIYMSSTFQQGGVITNLTLDGANLRGTNTVNNGTLTINSGAILEQLTIQPAGQLLLATASIKSLYSSTITNFGTVIWSGGNISAGGDSIANLGLWQIAGDVTLSYGSSSGVPIWNNSGVLRKTAGSGVALLGYVNFTNQPSGLVDAQTGTIQFAGGTASQLGGTFNASATGLVDLIGGTWTDAGGVATGSGTNRLSGAGTFNFRTNIIPGLKLVGGNVYVTGTNTFQQAGAITNLTLDGATLFGTNYVGNGTLTVNSGALVGQLTVRPSGQLLFATSTGKVLYGWSLFNQGTVLWSGGGLNIGTTTISNGGLWQMTSDNVMSYGGGVLPIWTNSGTLLKSAGTGVSSVAGFSFYNQSNGLVQVDSGTLQLSSVTTNMAGELRLNGGSLLAAGTLNFNGGTLDGSGVVGASTLNGGIISPGLGGAGLLSFSSGLNLGSNATLRLDGTGLNPGITYDQLSVTGAVLLSGCALQVTTLPIVTNGTTFVIINNDGTDAVSGTFHGLAENAILPASNQLFRISYHGGTGNDVTLTRIANTNAQSQFNSATRASDGSIHLNATGVAGLTYTVQANSNLATTNWSNLGAVTADALGNLPFIDTAATNFSSRFYRWVWP